MNERLRHELLAMAAEDKRIRERVIQAFRRGQPAPANLADEWARIDTANTRRLREIVEQHGWPGQTMVGDDGVPAAWLLAQHADRDPVTKPIALGPSLLARRISDADRTFCGSWWAWSPAAG